MPLWLEQGHSHPLRPLGFVSNDPQSGQNKKHKNTQTWGLKRVPEIACYD